MRIRILLVGLVSTLAVAGCGSGTPRRVVTVTVDASSSSPAPSTSAPTRSVSPTPARLTRLPGPCDTQLTDYLVSEALGGRQLAGKDVFVVGQPEPGIGRIGYLNCRFGVTGTGAAERSAVEIGVSLYRTPAQAAKRVTATVDDYAGHGATARAVTVAGRPATLLTGGAGAGYAAPLLVLATGQRTVAVTVDPSLARTPATAEKDAVALAAVAVQRTGG